MQVLQGPTHLVQPCCAALRKKHRKKRQPQLHREEYRIINLEELSDYVAAISSHAATCKRASALALSGSEPFQMCGITKDMGLAAFLQSRCEGCWTKWRLKTSPHLEVDGAKKHFDINVRAVWGVTASGGGAYKLNEQLATMAIPGISGNTFAKIEEEIGQVWHKALQQEMVEAGLEEKRLAIDRNDFHEGVPAITVVGDGGWSRRSHKHSYNASGGVAILVGAATGRLLNVGMNNKMCYICTRGEARGATAKDHDCWRNWSDSSSAMENAIILEGFLEAESVHGIRYIRYVGDGDASVFANLLEHGPSWRQRGL